MMLEKVARFLALADQVFHIADSPEISAETKYELIFSEELGPRTLGQLFSIDYYDPDTSYEADVAAYVSALREKCSDLKKTHPGAFSTAGSESVVDLARQVAAETSPTDSVGHLARLFARKIVRQHEELVQLRAAKENS